MKFNERHALVVLMALLACLMLVLGRKYGLTFSQSSMCAAGMMVLVVLVVRFINSLQLEAPSQEHLRKKRIAQSGLRLVVIEHSGVEQDEE